MHSRYAHSFRPDEKIDRGFGRILRQMKVKARGLARRLSDTAEAVHETRTLIKRLRALLWFARPAMAPSAVATAKRFLRKAARLLAAERDLAASRLTLKKLAGKADNPEDRKALVDARRAVGGSSSPGVNEEPALRDLLRQAVSFLIQSVEKMERSVPAGDLWPSASERVAEAFRATRKAGKKALRSHKAVRFHAWRKKAKRLLYLLELTHAHPKKRMARLIRSIDKLQDKLGSYHDCVATRERLKNKLPSRASERRLSVLLEKRKKNLGKKARRIARRTGAAEP